MTPERTTTAAGPTSKLPLPSPPSAASSLSLLQALQTSPCSKLYRPLPAPSSTDTYAYQRTNAVLTHCRTHPPTQEYRRRARARGVPSAACSSLRLSFGPSLSQLPSCFLFITPPPPPITPPPHTHPITVPLPYAQPSRMHIHPTAIGRRVLRSDYTMALARFRLHDALVPHTTRWLSS